MPLDFKSIHLLLEHSGHYALQAVLGRYYYLWLVPLLIIAFSGVIYSCVLVWNFEKRRKKRQPFFWCGLFAVLLLLSILSNLFYGMSVIKTDNQEYYTGHLVRPLLFVSFDYANDAIHTIVPNDKTVIKPFLNTNSSRILDQYHMLPPKNVDESGELKLPADAKFDKIIIIAIESLDLNFIRAVNPAMPEEVTPVLDKLYRKYTAMSNYFTASQPTSWGMSSLLLSRPDYNRECKNGNAMSLFTIAGSLGYSTMYFSPLSGIFGENRKIYAEIFNPQLQYFLEDWSNEFNMSRSSCWGISDAELYDGVARILEKNPQKRFLAVISTMDTHPPYNSQKVANAESKKFPTPFLQSLNLADRSLGIFLRRIMNNKNLYNDRTLINVTADHSATHGENYLNRKTFTPDRIPLIFITPDSGIFKMLKTDKYASSIDLAPTLVPMLGGVVPNSFMGRNLFSKKDLAFCWNHGDKLLIYTPEKSYETDLNKVPDNDFVKAFADFFKYHYPVELH